MNHRRRLIILPPIPTKRQLRQEKRNAELLPYWSALAFRALLAGRANAGRSKKKSSST